MKKIGIIGLGYVGLPLALLSSHKGLNTTGFDIDLHKINSYKQKKYLLNEPYLYEWNSNNVTFTNVIKDILDCDIKIMCVPTPINSKKLPDLKYVIRASEMITKNLKENDLVIIESTIHPGVCEEIINPILEKSNKKYFLAHCPERINPGDKKWNVSNIPRVVGGINKTSAELATNFYKKLDLNVITLNKIKEAEATKILENTFRDINIAFINEMAQSFYKLGINIQEVIKGASTKPFGFMPHYPGVGVGGHCIAIDPYYMIQRGKEAGYNHLFLKLAREINSNMPEHIVNIIQDELNLLNKPIKNTTIAILGIAYKNNVADDRESPSYEVIKLLKEKKADLNIYDPYFLEKSNKKTLTTTIKDAEVIVLCTAHDEFIKNQKEFVKAKIIIDGRNKLNKELFKNIVYRGVGIH
ncbi:MAG: nucleotide sugar dehydrogenase [Candidatus Woesearchaeota archaeon]